MQLKIYIAFLAFVIVTGLVFISGCATNPVAPPNPKTEPGNPTQTSPTNEVAIVNFSFSPDTTTIAAGTTVTWRNQDSVPHTVTSRDNSFGSGNLAQDQSFSFTFSETGTFEYYCAIHPSMTGRVVVE